ncbi:hypothetical protein [Noviherbaspirillum sedimenti]|uniref:hypothetical protein n=1 Tax=Noviherbaspirillum sedimenti TaxID=2320865 RepID=UPI00131413B7|nr:hypothetical protein [Noviherbaspirillum sedimenti]
MVKSLAAVIAATAFLSLPAAAAPTKMTNDALDQVAGGTYIPCEPKKGDNGWGNGADGTNPGSSAGATAASKVPGVNQVGLDKINTNPTTSTGR